MAAELHDNQILSILVGLTVDEALALVAGPVVGGRDVQYAAKDAYGKVWDAIDGVRPVHAKSVADG